MADSRAKYRPVPTSEDDACHSDIQDGCGDSPTSEWALAEARASWTYFLLGCAILLPWNALINATTFFLSRLIGSPGLYQTFSSSMASVYTLTNLTCQFYCTITSKQSSPSRRIFASITTSIILVSSLCLSTFIRGTPPAFFSFALFNACLLAVTIGFLCTAVYAGAALLGPPFLQTVIAGQAAVAVAVSAVQVASSVVSLWGSPSKSVTTTVIEGEGSQAEAIAARIFFGVSAVFLGITLVAYACLTRQPFYKSVTAALEQRHEGGNPEEARLVPNGNGSSLTGSNLSVFRVFKQNWIFMFSIMYVFAVTLAVYPAITVRVRSVNASIHPLLFTSIHFLVFNVGDLVGRHSCSFPRLVVWSAKKILVMALFRTLFIPLFLLCNVDQPIETILASPVIGSDTFFMILMLTMGYTNGYVSTLALLAVSSLEHNPRLKGRREDVDVAATLGAAFVNLGLAVGSLSSFGVQGLL